MVFPACFAAWLISSYSDVLAAMENFFVGSPEAGRPAPSRAPPWLDFFCSGILPHFYYYRNNGQRNCYALKNDECYHKFFKAVKHNLTSPYKKIYHKDRHSLREPVRCFTTSVRGWQGQPEQTQSRLQSVRVCQLLTIFFSF